MIAHYFVYFYLSSRTHECTINICGKMKLCVLKKASFDIISSGVCISQLTEHPGLDYLVQRE